MIFIFHFFLIFQVFQFLIFGLWKSLSLWALLLVGVAHQNPPLTTTRPPTKFSSTKSWAAFQKMRRLKYSKPAPCYFENYSSTGWALRTWWATRWSPPWTSSTFLFPRGLGDVFTSIRSFHTCDCPSRFFPAEQKWKGKKWIHLPNQKHVFQTQLFCLTYSLSSLVTVEEEGNSEVVIAIYSRV